MPLIAPRRSGTASVAVALLALGSTACPHPEAIPPDAATAGDPTSSTGEASSTTTGGESTTTSTTSEEPTSDSGVPDSTGTSTTDPITTTSSTTGVDPTTSTGEEVTSTEPEGDACGNGVLDPGEECDQGFKNDDTAACTKGCLKATCGDHLVFADVEECDLGMANQEGVYGGCTPGCELGPHCGDGHRDEPFEQCDPEDPGLENAAVCDSCVWGGKVMFASSVVYSGALGGLSGADDKCQVLAGEAQIIGEGRAFRAWLSDGVKSAAARITHSDAPYILLDGTIVAEGWADLVDGTLAHPIDRNEMNEPVKDFLWAWTGTTPQGLVDPMYTCSGWTSAMNDVKGARGRPDSLTSTWSWVKGGENACVTVQRIYCVEQ